MGALWQGTDDGEELVFDWSARVDGKRHAAIIAGLNQDLDDCVLRLSREVDPRRRRVLQCQRAFLIQSLARVTVGARPASMRFSLVEEQRVYTNVCEA